MDQETFLTTLYVMIDDFCQSAGYNEKHRPGPVASLSCSEVVTLAIFGQWGQFPSERAFYRYAQRHLQAAFPTLPEREQFNRLQRSYREVIVAFALYLVQQMQAQNCLYEALDSSGVATRDAKRRGGGWLAGQADIGWSNRMGWYEGFHLLTSISPTGVITGFGFAPASCNDHPLAETFFAARAFPCKRLCSIGAAAKGVYVADKGFAGEQVHRDWQRMYGVQVVSAPHQRSKKKWSSPGGAGWQGCARSSRPFMTSCTTPSACLASVPMPWTAFKPAWRPRSLCITFVFGSTGSLVASLWLSLSCSLGKFVISIHTKRLIDLFFHAARSPYFSLQSPTRKIITPQ